MDNSDQLSDKDKQQQTATLAGGCFWCLEAVFVRTKGVLGVVSGYTGGSLPHPSYEQVCSGGTGHAEAVQITYDPGQISYEQLLQIFFTIHNPTTLNRQGADFGTQYRSAIYYHNAEQLETAKRVIAQLEQERTWTDPIVTELTALDIFYPAEAYHQRYYEKNPYAGYCQMVVAPKVSKFRKTFTSLVAN